MRFDPEFNALILSHKEFEILGNQLSTKRNKLSILSSNGSSGGVQGKTLEEFENLDGIDQEVFASAFSTLGEPLSAAELHYSVGDHSLTRSHLFWSMDKDEPLAVLTRRGEDLALTTHSRSEIQNLLENLLAINEDLASANLAVDLSAVTTLVALGLMEAYRFAHIQSALTHSAPPQSYSVEEVMERIKDADKEDFRWPLLFYEKILPSGTIPSIRDEEAQQAFEVLEEAGVLLSLSEEGGEPSDPAFYALSDAGELIADGLLQAASKVGMRVSRLVDESEVGHEALLFVRDPNYLWLFDVAGREGTIASLDAEIWGDLMQQVLNPVAFPVDHIAAQKDTVKEKDSMEEADFRRAATVMQSDLVSQPVNCPKCGALVKPGKRFCSSCGTALT
jgi:hypothetical protein